MPTTVNLTRLSDHQLLASARELACQERILNVQIIDHLTEIAERGLHLRHGFSSLFAYAVKELGFSEGAAHYRIQAKKLCADYPEVKQQLEEGTLTLTGAGQLQSAFDRDARRRRQRAREERRRESRGLSAAGGAGAVGGVSGPGGPDGAGAAGETAVAAEREEAGATGSAGAPGAGRTAGTTGEAGAPEAPEAAAAAGEAGEAGEAVEAGAAEAPLSESVKRELIEQAQGKTTRQISELIAALDPELGRSRDRLRSLGGDRWELKAVIDGDCQRGLEELRHLLSHVNPAMEYGELLQRLVADGLAKYDPARRPVRARRPKSPSVTPPATDGLVPNDPCLRPLEVGRQPNGSAAPPADIDRGRTWAPKSDDPQPSSGRHGSMHQPKPAAAAPAQPTNSKSARPGAPPAHSSEPRPRSRQGVAARAAADSETAATGRDCEAFAPPPRTPGTAAHGTHHAASLASADRGALHGAWPAGTTDRGPHDAAPPITTAERGPHHVAPAEESENRGPHDVAPAMETADRSAHQAAPPALIARGRTWAPKSDDPQPPSSHRETRWRARATITRTIPAAVRRHIWLRDRGRCTYRDPESGRCCGSRHLVQIDHVQPYAMGGSASAANLRLLCSAHNHDRATEQRRTRPARG